MFLSLFTQFCIYPVLYLPSFVFTQFCIYPVLYLPSFVFTQFCIYPVLYLPSFVFTQFCAAGDGENSTVVFLLTKMGVAVLRSLIHDLYACILCVCACVCVCVRAEVAQNLLC